MTCRDRILSEDFQDFLTYYILPEGTLEEEVSGGAFCFCAGERQALVGLF